MLEAFAESLHDAQIALDEIEKRLVASRMLAAGAMKIRITSIARNYTTYGIINIFRPLAREHGLLPRRHLKYHTHFAARAADFDFLRSRVTPSPPTISLFRYTARPQLRRLASSGFISVNTISPGKTQMPRHSAAACRPSAQRRRWLVERLPRRAACLAPFSARVNTPPRLLLAHFFLLAPDA